MSKKASKTLIGGFVVGAVVLAVTGVLVFGSGKFLSKTEHYVMYFEGSVKGLNIGSPVMFRGVKIGTVTDIVLRSNAEESTIEIPVFIEIEPDRFQRVGKKRRKLGIHEDTKYLVEAGLRAQLQMQSMVTGQLMIQLDFHPDRPARLIGSDIKYAEIPTIKTGLQALTKTLENLPIEEMMNKMGKGMENVNETLEDIQRLVENLDRTLAENAELPYYFTKAMEELSAAARSVRVLADYLEQHPDALLRGKGLPGGSK